MYLPGNYDDGLVVIGKAVTLQERQKRILSESELHPVYTEKYNAMHIPNEKEQIFNQKQLHKTFAYQQLQAGDTYWQYEPEKYEQNLYYQNDKFPDEDPCRRPKELATREEATMTTWTVNMVHKQTQTSWSSAWVDTECLSPESNEVNITMPKGLSYEVGCKIRRNREIQSKVTERQSQKISGKNKNDHKGPAISSKNACRINTKYCKIKPIQTERSQDAYNNIEEDPKNVRKLPVKVKSTPVERTLPKIMKKKPGDIEKPVIIRRLPQNISRKFKEDLGSNIPGKFACDTLTSLQCRKLKQPNPSEQRSAKPSTIGNIKSTGNVERTDKDMNVIIRKSHARVNDKIRNNTGGNYKMRNNIHGNSQIRNHLGFNDKMRNEIEDKDKTKNYIGGNDKIRNHIAVSKKMRGVNVNVPRNLIKKSGSDSVISGEKVIMHTHEYENKSKLINSMDNNSKSTYSTNQSRLRKPSDVENVCKMPRQDVLDRTQTRKPSMIPRWNVVSCQAHEVTSKPYKTVQTTLGLLKMIIDRSYLKDVPPERHKSNHGVLSRIPTLDKTSKISKKVSICNASSDAARHNSIGKRNVETCDSMHKDRKPMSSNTTIMDGNEADKKMAIEHMNNSRQLKKKEIHTKKICTSKQMCTKKACEAKHSMKYIIKNAQLPCSHSKNISHNKMIFPKWEVHPLHAKCTVKSDLHTNRLRINHSRLKSTLLPNVDTLNPELSNTVSDINPLSTEFRNKCCKLSSSSLSKRGDDENNYHNAVECRRHGMLRRKVTTESLSEVQTKLTALVSVIYSAWIQKRVAPSTNVEPSK